MYIATYILANERCIHIMFCVLWRDGFGLRYTYLCALMIVRFFVCVWVQVIQI